MWKFLITLLLQISLPSCVLSNGAYECGDHGRFEYCIDEIPGCVIGCHCHPGYYFDTDTKVCEPNSRLIEHHRRINLVKPDRVQKHDVTPNILYDPVPAPSTSKIDGQVNEIAKDANDLGDWLYDQFFKTIENQVINNTNDKDILTRRSGSRPPIKNLKKSRKGRKGKIGGKSSKQKGKKEHLRRKLLRITENDSLFDISSKSSSDSSDSSSSSDLSSMEYEVDESTRHKHDDDDHGHKKIVMINKKPKQPLPSFIFLPNLETPFYPPIGLPPPPIVPMYPMVPVPPVPLCPITGCDDNTQVLTTSYGSIATTIAATGAATTNNITTISKIASESSSLPEITTPTAITDANTISSDVPDLKRLRHKKKKKNPAKLLRGYGTDSEENINNLKYVDRQRLLQRHKEKMSNPSAKLFMPSLKNNEKMFTNKFINNDPGGEIPFLDNRMINDEYLNDNEINPKPMREDGTYGDNVDFKYITELIHRVDLKNKSNDLPPIEYNPLDSIELHRSLKTHKKQIDDYSVPFDMKDGRKMKQPIHNKPNNNPDESYYANLGRQIATMIRNIDSKDNTELQETPNKITNDHYFNKNSPTSFWERSVRSPLTYFKTKNKKFEYLKRSNELLFDIENKVEIIASTTPTLSLQEIENIVKIMEAAKRKIQGESKQDVRDSETSSKIININLLPQKSHNLRNNYNNQNYPLPYTNKVQQEKSASNFKTKGSKIIKPNNKLQGAYMHSVQKVVAWNGQNVDKYSQSVNQSYNIPTTAKPAIRSNYFISAPTNYNSRNPNRIPQTPERTNAYSQSFLDQRLNPYFLHHRKYFQDNSKYYLNQKEFPHFPPVVRFSGVQPTYFPELNHFD